MSTRLPRLHWGLGIAAVYIAFAGATTGFVAFAMRQNVELVRPDYYDYSLAHDAHRHAAARATALGDRFQMQMEPGGAAVTVAWPLEQAGRVRGTVSLYRPSDASADRRLFASPDAQGRQRIVLAGLAPGLWRLQVQWTVDGVAFYSERAVTAR
jgi:hypothetical protein